MSNTTKCSEAQQIAVALAKHGFAAEHTGGNCMAYVRAESDGETMITEGDDAYLPETWDAPATIGRYCREHGEPLEERSYPTVRELVDALTNDHASEAK